MPIFCILIFFRFLGLLFRASLTLKNRLVALAASDADSSVQANVTVGHASGTLAHFLLVESTRGTCAQTVFIDWQQAKRCCALLTLSGFKIALEAVLRAWLALVALEPIGRRAYRGLTVDALG